MPQTSRTFRIFVSSTFSDLKTERNALQEQVFPRLRDLALAHGCRFQAIDLRWGVSEEAALDQQTMKICLGEIERCQKTSPRPNFIILLGDRYGWRPVPSEIPASEFEQIINTIPDRGERLLVESWYWRDDNANPPVYCLQPRGGEFVEYETWEKVEMSLRQVLLSAVAKLSLTPEVLLKYSASATELEIVAGALKVQDASKHVFCFLRDIQGLPENVNTVSFCETDPQAARKQSELKARLRQSLAGNVHEYTAHWQGNGPSQDHLAQLCEDVYAELSKVILAEVGLLEAVEPLEMEIAANEVFAKERACVFIGRAELLNVIETYIEKNVPHPLAIWGVSGSGKSALMAKAVEQAQKGELNVLYRFIGATPESSNGRALLESLCRQISRRYGADETAIPSEYKDIVQEFPKRLALAKPEKPLIIFLDALDQLSDTDNARSLVWLPTDLPPNVRLVVSTLPGECLQAMESKLPAENRLEVQPMSVIAGKAILDTWFENEKRRLQDMQEQYLLDKFKKCGLPLYLKLAFEEARLWKSYDALPELSEDIPGILHDLFKRLSLESNHGSRLVSRSLGYLVAAKNGLSEDELLNVLSLDAEVLADFQRRSPKSPDVTRLPVVVWSRIFFDLEPYLIERSADGTSLLGFYHRQMAEACQKEYRSTALHAGLASYFNTQPLYLEKEGQLPNLRKLSEQVYQQAFAELPEQVEKSLLDYNYLKAKLIGKGVLELIEDYALVPVAGVKKDKEKPLSLLQGALRLSAYVLGKDPLQLPSQLTGRLLGFEEPDLNGLLVQIRQEERRPWLRPLHSCLDAPGGALIRTLEGHGSFTVGAVAVTPDGSRAVSVSGGPLGSGTGDGSLNLWDLESGICIRTLKGHMGNINAVALTADGRRAISGSWDKTLRVWDLEKGICTRKLEHPEGVISVAMTPDGCRAVSCSGSNDKIIRVWELESGICIRTLNGHTNNINAVAMTSDGRRAISGSDDSTVKVWDLESGECICTLAGHPGMVKAVALTPDGLRAISGSHHGILKVWDLEKGICIGTLKGHTQGVRSVVLTTGGQRAISGSWDGTLRVWDLESGICIGTLKGHTKGVQSVAMTEDGRRAISGSDDSTVKVWDLESTERGEIRRDFPEHSRVTRKVLMMPDGLRAISDSDDNTIKMWDLETGSCIRTLTGHTKTVRDIAISPNGQWAISGSDDNTRRVWDLESGQCLRTLEGNAYGSIAVTADGQRIVIEFNGTPKVWDLKSGTCISTLDGRHTGQIEVIALTADGRWVLTGSNDKTLKLWDLESGTCIHTLEGHTSAIKVVAIAADGLRALSGGWDNTIKFWDLKSGECIRTLKGHTSVIEALALTPDGLRAVSGSIDQTLKVWDLESGACLHTLKGHTSTIQAVMITLDGMRAISKPFDKTLKVWDLESGLILSSFESNGDLRCISVATDGLTFAAGDAGGRLYFLHLENITPDESILTAWCSSPRLLFQKPASFGFGCPHCRSWSEISQSALGKKTPCPNCGKPIKLNTFTIEGEWEPIAKAWQ